MAPGKNHEKPSTERPEARGVDHEGALWVDERHPQGPELRESLLEKQLEAMHRENEVLRQRMALKDIAIELNVRPDPDRTKKMSR